MFSFAAWVFSPLTRGVVWASQRAGHCCGEWPWYWEWLLLQSIGPIYLGFCLLRGSLIMLLLVEAQMGWGAGQRLSPGPSAKEVMDRFHHCPGTTAACWSSVSPGWTPAVLWGFLGRWKSFLPNGWYRFSRTGLWFRKLGFFSATVCCRWAKERERTFICMGGRAKVKIL